VSTAATSRVHLDGVTHRFGDVTALADVNLDVLDGEFITLLGPSGCGKTTLLRIVAGFERPTEGRVLLGGVDVTRIPPYRRRANMVFQRPTLFPHLDVFENVAFGLRIAKVSREEIRTRVRESLELVRLEGYEDRKNYELSGGQMQRVALARALVNRPQVLLLDEPLSALDLKIRLDMEIELRRLHRETGATFVYVTHDQREALALSDRIVVFNAGSIEQVGEPNEVYRRPATPFVARFVGDANVVPVTIERGTEGLCSRLGDHEIVVGADAVEGPAWLVLRPEVITVRAPGPGAAIKGTVRDVSFRGTGSSYRVAVPGIEEPIKAEMSSGPVFPIGAEVALSWDSGSDVTLRRSSEEEA
jgi:ABC-type Fe3+/spermidine/putrescine transport system ATPase subunit